MFNRVLCEPFKIKSVEPIRHIHFEERCQLLEKAHYNPFLLAADDVMIDLLTDSGTGAMSAQQWSAIMSGDEAYAGSRSYYEFRDAVRDIFTMHEVIPAHQGRAAEHLLFGRLCKDGDLVPNNTHFDTTRANLECLEVEALDLVIPEAKETRLNHPFKGNMDTEALARIVKVHHQRIPFALITITNNSAGGQPVSLANMRRVKEILTPYKIPLYVDAARFAENAWFIKTREPGQSERTPIEIAREFFSYADGAMMSAKKDGMVNIGGFLALRDPDLAERLRDNLILTEGFPTYGGLAGRDLAALACGLYEALDPNYLRYRIRTVAYMADKLRQQDIPFVEPPGGHAIYLDAGALLPHLTPAEFPGQSLCCGLYMAGGVRGVEIGSVMFGSTDSEGKPTHPPNELVRLAFPRRVYTQSHFDYVVEVLAWIKNCASKLPGMKMVHEPPFLRHFTAHFKPFAPFPDLD